MAKQSLKVQAYNTIKEKILNCEYAPNTFINEEMLQEEIKVSRTPIRDAIGRLEQEGLVRILPKKGIVISEMSLNTINTVYEMRFLLEPYAVERYGNRINQAEYLKYHQLYEAYFKGESQIYHYDDMDNAFHELFISCTNNEYFIKMYELIVSQVKRMRIMTGDSSEKRRKDTIEEHMLIIKYAMKQDWTSASSAMHQHLENSKNSVFDLLLQKNNWSL